MNSSGFGSNVLGLRGSTVGTRPDDSSNSELPLTFCEYGRREQGLRKNLGLTFNPSTGVLTVPGGLAGAVAAGAVDIVDISNTLGAGSGGSGSIPLLTDYQLRASHGILLNRVSELEGILGALLSPPP